jgi:hypothetical protein
VKTQTLILTIWNVGRFEQRAASANAGLEELNDKILSLIIVQKQELTRVGDGSSPFYIGFHSGASPNDSSYMIKCKIQ